MQPLYSDCAQSQYIKQTYHARRLAEQLLPAMRCLASSKLLQTREKRKQEKLTNFSNLLWCKTTTLKNMGSDPPTCQALFKGQLRFVSVLRKSCSSTQYYLRSIHTSNIRMQFHLIIYLNGQQTSSGLKSSKSAQSSGQRAARSTAQQPCWHSQHCADINNKKERSVCSFTSRSAPPLKHECEREKRGWAAGENFRNVHALSNPPVPSACTKACSPIGLCALPHPHHGIFTCSLLKCTSH